ncbi:neuropeptide S receptor-like [Argiope bruennichi]|uniref:Vasopressin V1b receptor like protein n=1 Tax=Argiope bruennichi TaxID=94029 RepID=A0A8T0ENB6_ARGBR|nr:neuropeptide S receptor-like [Argiope bruennichi]KAF8777247.1 Vasopressin V1b receptor like protein [Argiope bruennichi]
MDNLLAFKSTNSSDQHSQIWTSTSSSLEENAFNFEVLGPAYTRTLRIGLLTVMIITSLFGNVAVIFSICLPGCRKLRRIQVLFLNLAVADLLVCLFTITSQLIWECMGREWVAGTAFCPIFKVLQTFTMVCSNYLIVSIALDRFIAVVYPLRRRPNTKNYLLGAWLMSFLPSLPSAYIFHLYNDPSGRTFCVAKFYTDHLSLNHRRLYMAFILTSVFMIPISIIIVVYTRIVHVVWTRQKPFSDNWSSMESVASSCTPSKENGVHSNYPKAMVKTFWMTAIVVISFLVCALPYFVLEFYIAFGDPKNLNEDVVALLGIMSAANSSINPFVYLISNSRWCSKTKTTNVKCSCFLPIHMKKDSGKAVMSTSV